MSRSVFCVKLKKELDGLDFKPFPGELGDKIYNSISKDAWTQWLSHQTMIINENRLNLAEDSSRKFLRQQLEFYLFGE